MVVIGSLVVECVGPRLVVTFGLVVTDGLVTDGRVVTGTAVVGGLVSDLVEAGLLIGCVVSGPKSRI